MLTIKIKKLSPTAKIPYKMSSEAAGYDIFSNNSEDIIIKPHSIALIPTGFSIELPKGYEAQIRPRSGLALKHQIGVLNSPGTIDPDYRGEVKVILFNFGESDFIIKPNMRIAQMIISKFEEVKFILSNELSNTKRDKGGFGHTKF